MKQQNNWHLSQLPRNNPLHVASTRECLETREYFYLPDVLPVTQPTVSRKWRKHKALTQTGRPASYFLYPHGEWEEWVLHILRQLPQEIKMVITACNLDDSIVKRFYIVLYRCTARARAHTRTHMRAHTHTRARARAHTHTHTSLMALFPGQPRWASTRKVKPMWILMKQETVSGSGISWAICKSAPCSRQTTTPAPHHFVFTGRMPFLPPNQQRQSTEDVQHGEKL